MISTWSRRVALGAAVLAVAALVGIAPTAASAATAVTAVSVEANPFTPAMTSTYTVEFTTSATGALASGSGTITLTDGGNALTTSATYMVEAKGHNAAASRQRIHWQRDTHRAGRRHHCRLDSGHHHRQPGHHPGRGQLHDGHQYLV